MLKNDLWAILYFGVYLIGSVFLLTIANYFNLISEGLANTLRFLIPLLGIFGTSYFLGKKCLKNGYLEGLKLGGIIVFGFVLVAIVSKGFKTISLVYYLILLIAAILGSMIGINKKKADN